MVRDSHAELNQIFQTAADGMRVVDKEFNMLRINETFLKLAGISRDKAAGRKCYEVFPGPLCHTPGCSLIRIFGGEEYVENEVEKVCADGNKIPCIVTATPFRNAGGDVIGIVEDFKDITERKKAEEALQKKHEDLEAACEEITATEEELRQNYDELSKKEHELRESEGKYRDLVELLPQTVFELDEKGTISTANSTALKSFGYTQQDLDKGLNGFQMLVSEDCNRARENMQRTLCGEMLGGIEYTAMRKDGSTFPVIIYADAIIQDMNPVGIRGILIDITERKQAEDELKTSRDELELRVKERTEELNRMNEELLMEIDERNRAEQRLTQSLHEKEILLREIHHRVKNNLQIIASLLNLQSKYIKDETTLAAIRDSQTRVRAMALVHEKLYRSADISKIGLDEYIRFLGTNLFQFFGVKGTGITFRTDIQNISVDINTAIPLGLIMNELISNSLKHAFPDWRAGEIFVSVKREDHILMIQYQDNGAGIQQDLDWRNAGSLGLRLVISLVEQLRGTIDLDRTGGTKFTIVIQEKK